MATERICAVKDGWLELGRRIVRCGDCIHCKEGRCANPELHGALPKVEPEGFCWWGWKE